MEATTRKKKSLAFKVALGATPLLLLLMLGGTWAGWRIADRPRPALDMSLGGFFGEVDPNGPGPRRLSIGFHLGTPTPAPAAAKPANAAALIQPPGPEAHPQPRTAAAFFKYLLCWRYLRTRYIALASVIGAVLGVADIDRGQLGDGGVLEKMKVPAARGPGRRGGRVDVARRRLDSR
ncbi:MAG: hypothetical protein U0800_25595 [Isosphaeraceae bacterium]